MMMTSICQRYWQLVLAQGVVTGLGAGALFLPSVAILPMYFTTRKSLAQGISASGAGIGAFSTANRYTDFTDVGNLRRHRVRRDPTEAHPKDWVRLDRPTHCFSHARNSASLSLYNSETCQPSCSAKALGYICVAIPTVFSLCPGHGLEFHGLVHPAVLRARLRASTRNRR